MCMFPLPNLNIQGEAYRKGITEFACGACPECLSKRAGAWALRAVMEAGEHEHNCMICLTYDSYIRDGRGRIVGEAVADRHVLKRDIQLFIKRLRKWYFARTGRTFKYLVAAEYGKRTHRPHYHAILFGVEFPDAVPYKRSKRGNLIYRSATLSRLWGQGICTVDSVTVNSKNARYCTKYAAKDTRTDDTFMLTSRGIGEAAMLRMFNGKSFIVEGREYPIPRQIWQKKIVEWYSGCIPAFDYRYKSRRDYSRDEFLENVELRRQYRKYRDNDPAYVEYLAYWRSKGEVFEDKKIPVRQRILALDDCKYHAYKTAALDCLNRRERGVPAVAPRSNCKSAYERYCDRYKVNICPSPSCHGRADDTVTSVHVFWAHRQEVENKQKNEYLADCLKMFPQTYEKLLTDIAECVTLSTD